MTAKSAAPAVEEDENSRVMRFTRLAEALAPLLHADRAAKPPLFLHADHGIVRRVADLVPHLELFDGQGFRSP